MKNSANSKSTPKVQKKIEKIWTPEDPQIPSDVFGSYTGTPVKNDLKSMNDIPVQDADDL